MAPGCGVRKVTGDLAVTTIWKRLGNALLGSGTEVCCDPSSPALRLVVKCERCGELIRARVDKAHELQCEYERANGSRTDEEEEPRPTGYTLIKELVGANCQNLVHVEMHFDSHRHITARHVEGGEFAEVLDCE